jgi:hypothetical protein
MDDPFSPLSPGALYVMNLLFESSLERQEGVAAAGCMDVGQEDLSETDEPSEEDDSCAGSSSDDVLGGDGDEVDTAGETSESSNSDSEGYKAMCASAPSEACMGAGILLLKFNAENTLAAWKESYTKKLKRKTLDPRGSKRTGAVQPLPATVGCAPVARLAESRGKAKPSLRKRRMEVMEGGEPGVDDVSLCEPKRRRQHKSVCMQHDAKAGAAREKRRLAPKGGLSKVRVVAEEGAANAQLARRTTKWLARSQRSGKRIERNGYSADNECDRQ